MEKIKVDKLLQDEVRAIVPFKNNDGKDVYVIVKNPTTSFKEELISKIWRGIENPIHKVEDEDLIKMLFDELVNIELEISIEDMLSKEISYELQCVLYHITKIAQEITSATYMNSEIIFMKIKNNELKKEVDSKITELEKIKNIKKK